QPGPRNAPPIVVTDSSRQEKKRNGWFPQDDKKKRGATRDGCAAKISHLHLLRWGRRLRRGLLVCRWLRGRLGRRDRRGRLCLLLRRSGALRRLGRRWSGSGQRGAGGQRPYFNFAARLSAGLHLDALRIDALGLGEIGHRILGATQRHGAAFARLSGTDQ